MDTTFVEKLRQKYIKDPPEGMTARPVHHCINSLLRIFLRITFQLIIL